MKNFARTLRFFAVVLAFSIGAIAPVAFGQVGVTDAQPSAAAPGTTNLQVTISGSGFKRGAKASFVLSGTNNPGDIIVSSTAFSGSSQVVATISVAATATNATYDVVVMNTSGSSGKGTELFGVNNNVNKNGTINVLTTVYDTDASGATLLLRGDNPGAGQAGYGPTSTINSDLWANLWELDLRNQTTRTVYLTFSSPVAGSPASPLPDGYYDARVMTRCFDANNNIFSLFAIPLGNTDNRCSLRVTVPYNGTAY